MSDEAENNDTNGAGWSALRPLTGSEADEMRRAHRRAMRYAVKVHARDKAEIQRLRDALEYIAHAGLSARHMEDHAREALTQNVKTRHECGAQRNTHCLRRLVLPV